MIILPNPERVPFRGSQYVNAREYDTAVAVAERLNRDNDELRRKNVDLLKEVADLRFPAKPARRPSLWSRLLRR